MNYQRKLPLRTQYSLTQVCDAQMPANRKNPGVRHTGNRSRDGVPSGPGALANSVEDMRSRLR